MQVGLAPIGIGAIIALVVILLAILGMLGVLPDTPLISFGLIGALGIARLVA